MSRWSRRREVEPTWVAAAKIRREQWAAAATSMGLIVACGIVLWQLGGVHALLSNTTTTGGDTGAHYLMPEVLDGFLRSGHLTGWYQGWYDGLPLYTYYFVLPDVFVALASHLFAYNVAFKLATVVGSLLLPIACYCLGRGFGLRRPFPLLLGVGSLLFLFEQSYTINGGNLYSTLAGEYSFSFSLTAAVFFLAVCAKGISTGRHLALAAVLLAMSLASHVIPFIMAMFGLLLIVATELAAPGLVPDSGLGRAKGVLAKRLSVVRSRRQTFSWAVTIVVLGVGTMAWWFVPFVLEQRYANPMGYLNSSDYAKALAPGGDRWAIGLALVGGILAAVVKSRFGMFIMALTIESAMVYRLDPQGALFNDRLLPLYYLALYLSAAWTIGALFIFLATAWRRRQLAAFAKHPLTKARPADSTKLRGATSGAYVGSLLMIAIVINAFPGPQAVVNKYVAAPINAMFGTHLADDVGQSSVAGWATYNFSGMEGRGEAWTEFQGIMAMARGVCRDSGAGRMFWEYESNQDRFGTPMALMLLPKYTNNCIDSQEGLLFESSATTPYHFLNQSLLSVGPSRAQVGLNYQATNVHEGALKLQLMGVKYYLVSDPSLVAQAEVEPLLREVAASAAYPQSSGASLTWHVFEVADTAVVVPLHHLPVVVSYLANGGATWKVASTTWYGGATAATTPLVASGPPTWPRGDSLGRVEKTVHPGTVSNVRLGQHSLSFTVSKQQLGKPVIIRMSYFPNWTAHGATGPYRATPNFMVVVPTSTSVALTYEATIANWLGATVTLLSVGAIGAVATLERRQRKRLRTNASI
jgi:hypothetical protein